MGRRMAFLALVLVLVLGGCDQILEENLFQKLGLGQVSLEDMDTSDPAAINDAAESPAFYIQLKDNPTAKSNVIATLTADPANTEGHLLAAAIELKTSDAGAVVDNFAGQLANFDGSNLETSISDISKAILPANIAAVLADPTPPTEFVALIQSFVTTAGYFETALNNLGEGETLPSTSALSTNDAAFYALVSMAIVAVEPAGATGETTPEDKAAALWSAFKGEYDAIQVDTTVFSIDDDPMTPASTFETLLEAAGISLADLGL